MTKNHQDEVIEFLARPETHGLGSGRVDLVRTHISVVFLAGRRAYKMKRAVRFPYLDFSTLDKRRSACERELRLNRRSAPGLYRAVVAVTREAGGRLAIGGTGQPVEWLVEMVRFDDDKLLDRLAPRGELTVPLVTRLALSIAAFHEAALPRRDYGGSGGIRRVIDGNLEEMIADRSGTMSARECAALHALAAHELERHAYLMDARRVHGLVRQCHGDLHLHNVCLIGDTPTLFDAIEFNDDLACVDVMYDFAFLLMDLLHRDLQPHANAALNAYLTRRADYAGLALLPLYLSCRAAVRAKVCLAQAASEPHAAAATLRDEASAYLASARRLLRPPPPRLTAIGGLSGSGKSTLARLAAPSLGAAPGAVVLRSDVIRKRMFGVDELHRLPKEAYAADVSDEVYSRALHAADACLHAGHSAIVDAVFGSERHRRAVERLALEAGVAFTGLWIDVPVHVAEARLLGRAVDASDATPEVLARQADKPVGIMTWIRIDGDAPLERVLGAVQRAVRNPVVATHAVAD